jgi:hypothetical protein
MNFTPPKRAPAETSICLSFLSGNDIMIAKTGSGQTEGNAPIVVRKDELLGACDPAETRLFSNFSHVCPETVLASIRFFKHKDGIAKKDTFRSAPPQERLDLLPVRSLPLQQWRELPT